MNRIVACLLVIVSPILARAENWPQWRGPANNGVSKETKVATSWGEDKNVAWKLPMPGIAGSTPAIWGEKIFLTSADGKDLVLMCVSTAGKEKWKKVVTKSNRASFRGDEGNEAGASPSTDGSVVVCFFGTGDLACYDMDGNQLWNKNVQKEYGKFSIQHGMHITPLLADDRVYVVMLTNGGHWIACLDKVDGHEIWKHERKSDAQGESREAYSSPIIWNDGKNSCLVVLGCDYTTAHSLKDGSEIWRLADLNPKTKYSQALRIIASPVATKDELVVPTARGGLVVGMKPGATGLVNSDSKFELWRKKTGAPDVPSPLIYDGNVYLVRENGTIHVWDALTGKERYTQRLHSDRGRASPVAVAGNVITSSREGTFHVIKAGAEYQLVSQNTLKDTFTASPAISGGRIYLRGFGNLYAIEEKK